MTVPESQKKHEHLLDSPGGESADQMWARAGEFTNNVCYDVRERYALIKKSGGRVCNGKDCDKIIERRNPHKIYDLVRAAGSISAEPIFDYTGHDGDPSDFADPVPYDDAVEPPTNGQPPANTVPWVPYDEAGFNDRVRQQLHYDYNRRPQGADFYVGVWSARVFHSAYMGPDRTPLGMDAAIRKHRPEWCAVMGIAVDDVWF